MNTIDITPDMETGDWISTAEAAKILGKSDRTIQEMGKSGRIISRISGRPDQPRARLYDAKDVKRLALANRITRPPQFERKQVAAPSVAPIARKVSKQEKQAERALDTVSLVGNLVAGHKSEIEMLVEQSSRNLQTVVSQMMSQMTRNLETVVSMVLTAQKAESDANRERLKAEREDARERWEMEWKDRLERRKARSTTTPPARQSFAVEPRSPKARQARG